MVASIINTPASASVAYQNTLLVTLKLGEPCFYTGTEVGVTDPQITDIYVAPTKAKAMTVEHWHVWDTKYISHNPDQCLRYSDLVPPHSAEPEGGLATNPEALRWSHNQWYRVEIDVKNGPAFIGAVCISQDQSGNVIIKPGNGSVPCD